MLPHASLHPDQVRMMVRWVYGLKPGQGQEGLARGLSGRLSVPADDKIQSALLTARYTDAGRDPAGSLEGQTTVRLRPRRLQAEAAEEKNGLRVLGHFLGAIDHDHYARFENLHLASSRRVTFRVASGGQGGRIELRAESPEGPLLAHVDVKPTG